MTTDLAAYVPRLLLDWQAEQREVRYRAIEGTLVFADVSGFTKLSEKLERAGRVGAEQMADVINHLFGELLMLAAVRGGEMLKYGGDAMLLFFVGDGHAPRAAAACVDMQRRLHEIGRVDTGAGTVRLRMSVGAHSGNFDLFVGGRSHLELVVAGPATTTTVSMEAAADAQEILVSRAMAALLPERNIGPAKADGFLLRGTPKAPLVEPVATTADAIGARFLDASLATHLAEATAPAEHRLATVSFLQFLELDRLIEAGRAGEAAARVDDVLTLVQESFTRYGVTFLATDLAADGGKVMAAAGAPSTHEDDAERMLLAARAILDAEPALPVRIGINRGHVFTGDVGPLFRRTYTAIGDVTNTAARVMGRAEAGQCLVLEPVLTAASTAWHAVRSEPFLAKGKSEPLVPWAVGAAGHRRTREPTTPLIGREREMDALRSARRQTDAGDTVVVDVLGEPGTGKSRLVEELRAEVVADGGTVVMVRCEPFSSTTAYATVSVLAAAVLGSLDAAALQRECARVPSLAPDLSLVGLALGIEVPHEDTLEELDATILPARITAATAAFLAAALHSATAVIIEDAHVTDEASGAVLDAVRGFGDESGGLLLVATRRAVEDGWRPESPDVEVHLEGLDRSAAMALIEAASPTPLLPDEIARLADQAGGNPLFAEQLAIAPPHDSLPDSLLGVIGSRIDRLSGVTKDLLRRLAVLGPTFGVEMIAAVADERQLPADLQPFVHFDGERYAFAHALLQQTAYSGLPFRRRRELHRRVVAHLLEDGRGADRVEELAQHCDAGAMWPDTWRYSTAAARVAEGRYAFGIAASHWDRAARAARLAGSVEPAEIASAWRCCGEAARRAGQVPRAQAAYRAGRKVAPRGSPESVALAASIGTALLLEGLLRAASTWANRARRELTRLEVVPFEIEASVLELRAELADRRDRLAETVSIARQLVGRARETGDLQIEARAQATVHAAAVRAGLPEADIEGAQALDLARRAGNLRGLVNILSNLADAAERRAEWAHASELYAQASDAAERAGFILGRAVIDNNVGEIYLHQGRMAEALRLFQRAHTTAAAAGHWHAAFLTANIGWIHGLEGRFDDATAAFDSVSERLAGLGLLAEVERRRALVALLRGDGAAALQLLDGASLAPTLDVDLLLQVAKSHALRQVGRCEEALAVAQTALARAEASANPYARLAATEALSRLGGGDADGTSTLSRELGIIARPALP